VGIVLISLTVVTLLPTKSVHIHCGALLLQQGLQRLNTEHAHHHFTTAGNRAAELPAPEPKQEGHTMAKAKHDGTAIISPTETLLSAYHEQESDRLIRVMFGITSQFH